MDDIVCLIIVLAILFHDVGEDWLRKKLGLDHDK